MSRSPHRRRPATPRPPRPPRLPRTLLGWVLPPDARDGIVGDLDEVFVRRVREAGRARASLWYVREVAVVGARLAIARGPRRRRRAAGRAFSALDVKLGLRMLAKYPGLTLVAGLTLAVGIPVGMYPLHIATAFEASLPFEESDRVLVLRYTEDRSYLRQRVPYEAYTHWRENLASFETVAATTLRRTYNVISEDGRTAPVRGADVTASLFEILRVAPMLGRALVPSDEVSGAADVVVLSHDLWTSRLGADPDVVGRAIRVGGVRHTVVGVMPRGFLYPMRDHLWRPLRLHDTDGVDAAVTPQHVFMGRLAEGVSAEEAAAELSAVSLPWPRDAGDPRPPRRAEAVSLSSGLLNSQTSIRASPELYFLQAITILVLLVACANVGMLVFARTVMRGSELAVRTALGAGRGRLIAQLFTESLVLAVTAAGTGLLIVDRVVVPLAARYLPPGVPFWLDFGVTPRTVLRAMGLAVLSACVVGLVPALKATGRSVHQNLQRAAAGRSGLRFGGVSGAFIVIDVALAVSTVAFAIVFSNGFSAFEDDGAGHASDYLSAALTVPRATGPAPLVLDEAEHAARVARTQEELVRRLVARPDVRGVAMADALPGMDHDSRRIEVDATARDEPEWYRVGVARIAPGFFDAFRHPILEGRGFDRADAVDRDGRSAVIVNTDFVEHVLEGRNAIGRRVRYTATGDDEPGPWREIVGVVGRLGTVRADSEPLAYQAVYEPLAAGDLEFVHLAIDHTTDAESFAPRLRALASQVDAAAFVSDPRPLDRVPSLTRLFHTLVVAGAGLVIAILIALAASGIYALMSFTITQRTREIGIRVALGADRARVAAAVARRALLQLAAGVALGMPFAAYLLSVWDDLWEPATRSSGAASPFLIMVALTLAVGAATMLVIGVIACTGPTLRALRIAPTDALRAEG